MPKDYMEPYVNPFSECDGPKREKGEEVRRKK